METGSVNNPLVSVIIPAYNAENFIVQTINSVLKQTHNNIEIIVVNDGSTDDTKEVVEQTYRANDKIKLINQGNSGAAPARNTGYKNAKGRFIKFLDGDDLINEECLESQVALAIKNNNCIISGKWGRFYNDDINTLNLIPQDCWQTLPAIEWLCSSWKNAQSMTNPGIFLIPRIIIEKAGLWDESLTLLDDTEYFTRTIMAADKVIFSNNSLLYYRSGNQNSLSAQIDEAHAQSAYQAVLKSTQYLTSAENSERTRLLSANSLQQLLYSLYPEYPPICESLEKEIKKLGGSNLKWLSSPKGEFFSTLIGWKTAKKIQRWLR